MLAVRVALRLAPIAGFAALAACVPPAPLSASGALPPPNTTYAVAGDIDGPTRAALADGLAKFGLREVGERPDRYVTLTLSDRPRVSGTFTGTAPASRDAPGWTDQPHRNGLFSKGRREVRLAIRFLNAGGTLIEERVSYEVVTAKAPPADLPRLIVAALNSSPARGGGSPKG